MKKKSLKIRIVEALQTLQGKQTKQTIADHIGDTKENVGRRLSDLYNAGEVDRTANLKTKQLEYFIPGLEKPKKKVAEKKPLQSERKATGKKPKESTKKQPPSKDVINEDGTIDYSKITSFKRGDIVKFTPKGKGQKETFGVVLYPDWDFWQAKCYLRITANGKQVWKLHSKVEPFVAESDVQLKEAQKTAEEVLEKTVVPKFTDWKRELCMTNLK